MQIETTSSLGLSTPQSKIKIRPQTQSQTIAMSTEEEKMIFKIEYDQYMKKKEQYENNMIKAYATIFEYYSKTIQACIRESSDYKTKIRNNPIELLKAIKKLMHSPIRAKYEYATLTDAFERLLNIKQQENKGLLNYTVRYKQEQDILKEYTGKDILHQFVEHTDVYKATKAPQVLVYLKNDFLNIEIVCVNEYRENSPSCLKDRRQKKIEKIPHDRQ